MGGNKLKKIVVCMLVFVTFICQTVFAEQMQIIFSGKTDANKQIMVLALDSDLKSDDVKSENIKYIGQFKSDSSGKYSVSFPFDSDGGYVFRSNADGTFRKDEGPVRIVYVSDSGSDSAVGDEDAPVKTLDYALSLAENGVNTTVILKNNATLKSIPEIKGGAVTIKGEGNITLTMPEFTWCNSNVTFDNIKLTKTALFAKGNKLIMGSGVSSDDRLTVYGGAHTQTLNCDTHVELYGGKYIYVYGGSRNSPINGNTNVIIGGNCNIGDGIDDTKSNVSECEVYGGGNEGSVTGTTNITLKDNAVAKYISGGGKGEKGTVGKSTNININGGSVMAVYGGSLGSAPVLSCDTNITMRGGIAESLFGGSGGTNLTGNTHINLLGGEVTRRVFAGCYNNTSGWLFISISTNYHVKGTTSIAIDNAAKLITKKGLSGTNTENCGIIAGSRTSSGSSEEINTLIFLNGSYEGKKSLIGDISGWSGTFKSFQKYTVKAGNGGTLNSCGAGKIELKPDSGMVACVGGKYYGNEVADISAGITDVSFTNEFNISAVKGNRSTHSVDVDYTAVNRSDEPSPTLYMAVYDKTQGGVPTLVKAGMAKCDDGSNLTFDLGNGLTPGRTYEIKVMMFNGAQKPLTNYYEITYAN